MKRKKNKNHICLFLYSGVCNLVLETGPDANVLTVINEKLTFVTNVKYTKEMLIRLIFRKTYPLVISYDFTIMI